MADLLQLLESSAAFLGCRARCWRCGELGHFDHTPRAPIDQNHTKRKHLLTFDTRLSRSAANKTAAMMIALNNVVFQHCHEIEQEFAAAVESLEKEKTAKTNDLLSVQGRGAIGSPVNDKTDFLFLMKCSQQLKEWTVKTYNTVVYYSKVNLFTHKGLFAKVKSKANCGPIGV